MSAPGPLHVAGRPARLYAILSDNLAPRAGFPQAARVIADAGVGVVQLRFKGPIDDAERARIARDAIACLGDWPGLLVINDRADLAALARAAAPPTMRIGLHLGQDDLPPADARAIVGDGVVVGLSTHDLGQVAAAADAPVDYLGFGPVFATATKARPDPVVGLDGLASAARASSRPVVGIGGVTRARVPDVLAAGAAAAVVASALLDRGREGLGEAARRLVEAAA